MKTNVNNYRIIKYKHWLGIVVPFTLHSNCCVPDWVHIFMNATVENNSISLIISSLYIFIYRPVVYSATSTIIQTPSGQTINYFHLQVKRHSPQKLSISYTIPHAISCTGGEGRSGWVFWYWVLRLPTYQVWFLLEAKINSISKASLIVVELSVGFYHVLEGIRPDLAAS